MKMTDKEMRVEKHLRAELRSFGDTLSPMPEAIHAAIMEHEENNQLFDWLSNQVDVHIQKHHDPITQHLDGTTPRVRVGRLPPVLSTLLLGLPNRGTNEQTLADTAGPVRPA